MIKLPNQHDLLLISCSVVMGTILVAIFKPPVGLGNYLLCLVGYFILFFSNLSEKINN